MSLLAICCELSVQIFAYFFICLINAVIIIFHVLGEKYLSLICVASSFSLTVD